MNRLKAAFAFLLPAAMLAISAPAVAQSDAGWYLGGAYGMTSLNLDTSSLPGVNVDDSNTGFKIFGGFQFNKYLGAEVGYVDFGKFAVTSSTGDLSATAYTLAGVGTLPLNESFALFGKVGMWSWKSKSSAPNIEGDSGSDVFYGAGARYNLNKNWGLTLEVEQYDSNDSVMFTSLGVRYKF
jgi:OOP family OmpA-OmpF porin